MIPQGHTAQMETFSASVSRARIHHAWLLTGPRGVGKACFADWASRLLLDAEDSDTPGAKLLLAGSHPDFRRLERLPNEKTGMLARNITVDQVRLLRALFTTATSLGNRRVIVIDSIDDMERPAANALLKSLEEPPASTVFLLVSHQPGRLLPTIRSRCRTLSFTQLPDATLADILVQLRPGLDPATAQLAIASARGSVATALAYADLDMPSIDKALTDLAQSGDPSNVVRSTLAHALSAKAASARYEMFLERAPAFLADHARRTTGEGLPAALEAWSRARSLSQIAVPRSLIAETVVFEMTGYVASLAPTGRPAKT